MRKLRDIFTHFLCKILYGKEGEYMMAMLWAQEILLGNRDFADVPARLKEKVKKVLVDSGFPELADEAEE